MKAAGTGYNCRQAADHETGGLLAMLLSARIDPWEYASVYVLPRTAEQRAYRPGSARGIYSHFFFLNRIRQYATIPTLKAMTAG